MNLHENSDLIIESPVSKKKMETIESDVSSVVKDSISDFTFNFFETATIVEPKDVRQIADFSSLNRELSIQTILVDNRWTPTNSYSARVVDCRNDTVTLELVIDKENLLTEERVFQQDFFENGKDIKLGQYFKLKCYKRPNCEMIQVINGDGIVNESDFPTVDFGDIISTSLFNSSNR